MATLPSSDDILQVAKEAIRSLNISSSTDSATDAEEIVIKDEGEDEWEDDSESENGFAIENAGLKYIKRNSKTTIVNPPVFRELAIILRDIDVFPNQKDVHEIRTCRARRNDGWRCKNASCLPHDLRHIDHLESVFQNMAELADTDEFYYNIRWFITLTHCRRWHLPRALKAFDEWKTRRQGALNLMPIASSADKTNDRHIDKIATKITQETRPDLLAPPPTDSGYGSASAMESKLGVSMQHDSTTNMITELSEQQFSDTATEYSNESITTLSKKPDYIWELADELFRHVKTLKVDEMTRTRVSDILPELLKVFALKIGCDGQTQMHRDVMVFVHRYRCEITAAFMDITFKQNQDDSNRRKNSSTEGMSLEDRMGLWFKETSFEEPPEEFLQPTTGIEEPTEEIFTEGAEFGNEKVVEGRILAYREFFIGSNAYEWLLARLQRECHLVSTEPNTIEKIREKITTSLSSPRRISRRVSPQSCHATFELDWDIFDFFNTQEYLKQPHEVFERVITVTGSCWDAQAATCAQYIKQTWPSIGEVVIRLIKEVLKGTQGHKYQCEIFEGTIITARINRPKFVVEAFGVSVSIAEVGELFTWLGAALKTSPQQKGLSYCVPAILNIVQETTSLQDINLQPLSTHITYEIGFAMEKIAEPLIAANGQCWHDIFRNPVVVKGYPIPHRTEWNTGLEISLNIMAGLAQTRRLDQFKEKVYIKGFSTILVPTKKNKDFLCWHLIYNEGGDRISYLDDYLDQEQHFKQQDLESCRHVLGWCSEAKLYAGSGKAPHPVAHSRLPKPNADCALAGVSVSGGRIILSGPSFSTGVKDTPVYLSRKGYIRQLKWISTKFVLLWDERDKRGWLINGTSALLHIVQAFLSHAKDDNFQSAFCFKSEDFKEAEIPYTAGSAIAVLLSSHNRALKLYEDEDEDGEYLLKSQIDNFYNILEKLIDYQADISGHRGDKLSDKPRRYLEGWDFEDLATECPILYPRLATIESAGKGWVDFIRAIHAVTLVGRGFGDIIQPAASDQCKSWIKVPTKRYYIASCASDLDRLTKEAGTHHDGHILLCDNLIYYTPTPVDMSCQCGATARERRCEPVGMLIPLSMSTNLPSKAYPIQPGGSGAVILGYNSHFPLIWGDTGPPQQMNSWKRSYYLKSLKRI